MLRTLTPWLAGPLSNVPAQAVEAQVNTRSILCLCVWIVLVADGACGSASVNGGFVFILASFVAGCAPGFLYSSQEYEAAMRGVVEEIARIVEEGPVRPRSRCAKIVTGVARSRLGSVSGGAMACCEHTRSRSALGARRDQRHWSERLVCTGSSCSARNGSYG